MVLSYSIISSWRKFLILSLNLSTRVALWCFNFHVNTRIAIRNIVTSCPMWYNMNTCRMCTFVYVMLGCTHRTITVRARWLVCWLSLLSEYMANQKNMLFVVTPQISKLNIIVRILRSFLLWSSIDILKQYNGSYSSVPNYEFGEY